MFEEYITRPETVAKRLEGLAIQGIRLALKEAQAGNLELSRSLEENAKVHALAAASLRGDYKRGRTYNRGRGALIEDPGAWKTVLGPATQGDHPSRFRKAEALCKRVYQEIENQRKVFEARRERLARGPQSLREAVEASNALLKARNLEALAKYDQET